MKARLTLTVDPTVIHRAKQLARVEGSSLSSMVENLLKKVVETEEKEKPEQPFSERWRSKLEVKFRDEPRYHALAERYDLPTEP